ncbi:MAG TPA: PEGA domain-containing protein [Chloroflexi bacterium]|nr:PEGA domain-containing protein [Chloroflexota bacterium]
MRRPTVCLLLIAICLAMPLSSCGPPPPTPPTATPVPPTPTSPPTATTALLMVVNHCGTPFYFTVAGSMYEVPGNGSVPIQLAPGQHTDTVSKPGFSDINETIYVEAGRIYTYPITCEVT